MKMTISHLNEIGYDTSNGVYLSELPDAIYGTFKPSPEDKLIAYAIVCLKTALRFSEDARQIFTLIVSLWELPGCQAFLHDLARGKEVVTKVGGNADCRDLVKYIDSLIMFGFNRKADLDNQTPKVTPGESPYLAEAISFCSMFDCLLQQPKLKGLRVVPDSEWDQFRWFYGKKPTTRMGRQVRHKINRTLREKGFIRRPKSKLFEDAEKWYKSRVNPGTIEDYVNELATQGIYVDRGRIENDIAPCDEVTGYPRQWRK